jgi:hypothetical protein
MERDRTVARQVVRITKPGDRLTGVRTNVTFRESEMLARIGWIYNCGVPRNNPGGIEMIPNHNPQHP